MAEFRSEIILDGLHIFQSSINLTVKFPSTSIASSHVLLYHLLSGGESLQLIQYQLDIWIPYGVWKRWFRFGLVFLVRYRLLLLDWFIRIPILIW